MADKKVERSGASRPLTPTQKMTAALSDPGTKSMAQTTQDKGKSALAAKFREREERWRTEQALHDREAAQAAGRSRQQAPGGEEPVEEENKQEGGDE